MLISAIGKRSLGKRGHLLYDEVLAYFFFFQAEDGIRDIGVTGVQTCALPISICHRRDRSRLRRGKGYRVDALIFSRCEHVSTDFSISPGAFVAIPRPVRRSESRSDHSIDAAFTAGSCGARSLRGAARALLFTPR